MSFASGALVRVRDREWVVLPDSTDELLLLRPLGGAEDEATGVLTALEPVEPATFSLPDPEQRGDFHSARLLRDALRLGFRSSAGPFRSFGHIAVEPRPYQLVPLLLALRLDPVRLLIADDVGIGKTVEASLVARELLDQGEARRLCVLCPPHLADQWHDELESKFHIDAERVLASTAGRLERGLALDETIFDRYDHTIVSTDFIKSDRRRNDFLRTCPELVIVDEAHTCSWDPATRGTRHQRYELVKGLAADPKRHLVLVTATPHSGHEGTFRSLLAFLDPDFADLPEDLSGQANERHRRALARHFVQRRRADIEDYADETTPFPARDELEDTYTLTADYRRLLDRVVDYAREMVGDQGTDARWQRVRWWSALALLRALSSSPAAAVETLRNRGGWAETETAEEADAIGERQVMDQTGADEDALDTSPGAQDDDERNKQRLQAFARDADKLRGDADAKLVRAAKLLKDLVRDGFRPIVFCRFIDTADYVRDELRSRLPKDVEVISVTGELPPPIREQQIVALAAEYPKRVLVCTDCLSEGINLQEYFDAVVHYDLSWNPTRHEQREGRVDRFGQPAPAVRVLTYYGANNPVDGIVLNVLLRKHKTIRSSLGISVPVPIDSNAVLKAVYEGLVLRGQHVDQQRLFDLPENERLQMEWQAAADREKRSRTMFAQRTIDTADVVRELHEVRSAIGGAASVRGFVEAAVQAAGGRLRDGELDLRETPAAVRELFATPTRVRFEPAGAEGEVYLPRTHPFVQGLASFMLDTALDPILDGPASRSGAIRTAAVTTRTTLVLARYRFHIETPLRMLLAEDCGLVAFTGDFTEVEPEPLLAAEPSGNVTAEQASAVIQAALDAGGEWRPLLEAQAYARAEALADAHSRVRTGRTRVTVRPELPPDVLGVYVLIPVPR
jgi:hypothetical protein